MQAEQQFIPPEFREMAAYLNLCPGRPDTWPMNLLDHLLCLRERDKEEFEREIRRIMKTPYRYFEKG